MAINDHAVLPASVSEALAGMEKRFNPDEAGKLSASILFNISSAESPDNTEHYHLQIGNGACSFSNGITQNPTLIINTPGDVWLKIARGEMNGTLAFLSGKYSVRGDLGLLMRLDKLFRSK